MVAPIVLLLAGGIWWIADPDTRYSVEVSTLILGFGVVVLGISAIRDLVLKDRGAKSPNVIQGKSCTL